MEKEFPNIVRTQLDYAIKNTNYDIGKKYQGKVRDVYDLGDQLLIITTDRISAFDHVLGVVPFKGEILNHLSLFWFEKTADIIPNHIIKKVSGNGVLVRKCKILPIEVIVRGYLTGGGWREYQQSGEISGVKLPAGLKKDSKLEKPILTPTTKAEQGHDLPISVAQILEQGIVEESLMRKIEDIAVRLFERGQQVAAENHLLLVDTKYEFGLLEDGTLIVADEIHTSDSSRFWYLDSYEECYRAGQEQKMLDKEFLRQYLIRVGYSGEGETPKIPFEIITGVLERYLEAYRKITGLVYPLKNYDAVHVLDTAVAQLKEEKK